MSALEAVLRTTEQTIIDRGEKLIGSLVDDGLNLQVQILDTAYTKTGIARVAAGGESAGRNRSGHMIEQIDNSVESTKESVTGRWGWPNPEAYFDEQDSGTDKIPAADSLVKSFLVIREKFFAGIGDIVRGR
jgi:hypothetical protein